MLFWAMLNLNIELKVHNNRNGTENSIQYLKIRLTFKESFDFTRSLTSPTGYLGCSCAYIFYKRIWGAHIEADALNRVNTVSLLYTYKLTDIYFAYYRGIGHSGVPFVPFR